MNNNIQLHYIQSEIIKKLALKPSLKFNELLVKDLESEHMNYHLKKLVDFKLVTKLKDKYELTDFGKDYSNLLDDEVKALEKQPKTSILLRIIRKNSSGEIEHLLSKRLRQPYFGKVGRLTGKIRFGESFKQAAERELYEETGLIAKNCILEEIYHKIRYREDKTIIQDVIFYTFLINESDGDLIKILPYQENFWITKAEVEKRKDLDLFDGLKLNDRFEPKKLEIVESIELASGY